MDDLLWMATLVFLVAGTIKGVVGIGLPTAAISLLSQFYPPYTAISLVIFPILVSNFWQVIRSGEALRTFKTFWPFGVSLMVFIWIFTGVSSLLPTHVMMIILGSVIGIFALTSLFAHPPALPLRYDRPVQVFAGTLAGIMGGMTALWSPPLVIYLMARRVQKDDFVRATGLLISMGSVPLLAGYWNNGLMTGPLALTSMAMIIPALVGFTLGEQIRRRIDAQRFQKVLLVIFLLMGLNLIRRALFP